MFFCCQSSMRCWTNTAKAHPHHVLPLLTQRILVGRYGHKSASTKVRSELTFKMKKSYATDDLARFFLWVVPLTLRPSWVSFTARYAERTYLYSHIVVQRSYGIFKGSGNSRRINASALRLPDGVSLFTTASIWPKVSWGGRATKFRGIPLFFGKESTRSEKTWFACFRKHWSSSSSAGKGFNPRRCAPTGWELWTSWTSLGTTSLNGQTSKCQRCLRHALRFWLVPYFPLIIWVDSLSHFWSFLCFSQSFLMECSRGVWLGLLSGWWRISNLAWNWKNAGLTLGCFRERGGRKTFTVSRRAWSTVTMAILVASWSFLGKFLVPLVVGHFWCPFIGGVKHSCGVLQGVYWERIQARSAGLPNFWCPIAQTLFTKTASTVFRTLDPFSMTEFIETRFTGAEHRDWMQPWQTLRKAIETGGLSFAGLLDVVSNIILVKPLSASYLKETGKKNKTNVSLLVLER